MKPKSTLRMLATSLLAAALLPLSHAAWAGPPEEASGVTELAVAPGDADIAASGRRQLLAGNAAYERGDFAEAFRLYRNIAFFGNPEVHYRLGVMYREGQGARKSLRQAEYWFKLAAAQRYPGAAEALATIRQATAQG